MIGCCKALIQLSLSSCHCSQPCCTGLSQPWFTNILNALCQYSSSLRGLAFSLYGDEALLGDLPGSFHHHERLTGFEKFEKLRYLQLPFSLHVGRPSFTITNFWQVKSRIDWTGYSAMHTLLPPSLKRLSLEISPAWSPFYGFEEAFFSVLPVYGEYTNLN